MQICILKTHYEKNRKENKFFEKQKIFKKYKVRFELISLPIDKLKEHTYIYKNNNQHKLTSNKFSLELGCEWKKLPDTSVSISHCEL